MTKFNHLSRENRDVIEHLINTNYNFTYIGNAINVDRTTISKEIRNNRYIKSNFYSPFDSKAIKNVVNKCPFLHKPPYVCNTCKQKNKCQKHHIYYNAKVAQENYEKKLSESRQGVNITLEHIDEIERIIVPLIKYKKQSINQVYINHSDILDFSKVTFYNYIDNGILSLSNIDLPKKVKYKKRKSSNINTIYKRDTLILKNRTHEDYVVMIAKHPKYSKVQLDTVIGKSTDKKCLLTMYIVETHYMLIFLLDKKTAENVTNIFKDIKEGLGIEEYKKIFRIILTDNGVEFFNPYEMEYDYEAGKKIANVFYCHPNASYEKHEIEVNHEYIRRVFPKGTSFENITTDVIKRLQDNINAIPRESLDGSTPFDLTNKKYPKLIEYLNAQYILPDDVDMSVENIRGDK